VNFSALSANDFIKKSMPKKIAVAWSGGADSTFLLICLQRQGYQVQAWHIDHGWSERSKEIADTLASKASLLCIDYKVIRLKKPQKNLEAEARKGRYAAFEQLAEETGCFHVALGHHADDQAETVCMRLLQGAGVAGCQGMKRYRKHGALHLWRPQLHVPRVRIEQALVEEDMTWLEDPSNRDVSLWRNKIRLQLFPYMNDKGFNPQTLFLRWQAQAERLQHQLEALACDVNIQKHVQADAIFCDMEWRVWFEHSRPVRAYLLQQMIGKLFADGSVFGRRHILAIEQWREHGGHGWLNLSGCCLYRQGKSLQLCQGKTSLRKDF